MKPPQMLKPGDTVRISIDKIGQLENPVILEPEGTPRVSSASKGGPHEHPT